MLDLPELTLCCVDTREPALALAALQRCMAGIRFARVLLFTDTALVSEAPPGIELVPLRIASVAAYSEFMLRGLLPYLHSSHLLVVQWDGYVTSPGAWDPAFLHYDYIGAPWHDVAGERAVGNGGFSLRSLRLLQALQDPALPPSHPEDLCICQVHRDRLEQQYGLRFAPRAMAAHFAFERTEPSGPTFGFHGLFNFDRVMPLPELQRLLATLPDAMLQGLDGHDLCARLIHRGQLDAAALIVAARRRLGMSDRRTWRLRARLAWARWRG
ncbi:DUF5672 family protein [Aquabacterium sp.]|uniref:DUF5672 family protein n=1 Tax=Aquabacterium sp. TaxID=1872578 RepID=UPI002B98DC36|nr:DUF5672 family protein [Aquabacterium sp.]HSW08057.1 DUF5672 family protein [Aquabacterium sp.]